ncbi:MAG TPA: hypothetical protein VGK37_12575 [Casimicrobiaceae bacterium]
MLRRLVWGTLLLLVSAVLLAHPIVYFGNEVRGEVVDDETGAPLEGTSIVGEWQIYVMVIQPHSGDRIKVIETETNKDGDYVLPAWGPVPRPPWGALLDRSPMIILFKSGYYPKVVVNEHNSDDMYRDSDFNGKTIRLRKFDGNFELLSQYLVIASPAQGGCWRECPHYVMALDAEARRLLKVVPSKMLSFGLPQTLETMTEDDRTYFAEFGK